jgi:hypothetical protein
VSHDIPPDCWRGMCGLLGLDWPTLHTDDAEGVFKRQ